MLCSLDELQKDLWPPDQGGDRSQREPESLLASEHPNRQRKNAFQEAEHSGVSGEKRRSQPCWIRLSRFWSSEVLPATASRRVYSRFRCSRPNNLTRFF